MPERSGGETDQRFERLLQQYSALLKGLISQHCPRDLGIDVVDVEQEARLRLWRALEREKELTDPASYIHRIAITTTIDAVRRVLARREDQLHASDDDDANDGLTITVDPSHAPDAVAERRELMQRIGAAVASLQENRRHAVKLHLQGLGLAEIAELLGWTEAKVRNLVYRGMEDLREALRGEGIEYE